MLRREFLGGLAGAATLPFLAQSLAAAATPGHWAGYGKAFVINNLGGLGNPNLRLMEKGGESVRDDFSLDPRLKADLKSSGMTAVNMTLGHVFGPGDPFQGTVEDIGAYTQVIRKNADVLTLAQSVAEIEAAKAAGKTAILYGFQNTTAIGDKPERVGIFNNLGVRIIQLTYNDRNLVGDGSQVAENKGLTKYGFELLEKLNATRTLVDLSHSGENTCLDAVKASKAPIVISHTGCRALVDVTRNKTDQEMKLVADKGGFTGIYFMPFLAADSFATAADAVRHVEHAINVCGEDHVGIGTDGGTTAVDDVEAYRAVVSKEIEERRKMGISAKGEKPGVVTFLPDLQGPAQFLKLADLLSARGHSDARIEKILGGNSLRVMKEVWGA